MLYLPRPFILLTIHFLLFGLLISNTAFAQLLQFNTYSVKEGLPQSQVNTIFQDSRGYLWIGTSGGGLSKYNGYSFENFDESYGLSGQIITCITEDKKGNVWAGSTWGGVSMFNGLKFKTLTVKNGLLSNSVNCIAGDDNNNIWIGTNRGLSIYDGSTFTHKTEENGLLDNDIRAIHKDSEGIMWIATPKGLHRYDGKGFAKLTESNGLPFTNIQLITEDNQSNLWLYVHNAGLVRMNRKSSNPSHLEPELVTTYADLKGKYISALTFDAKNTLYAATHDAGIFIIDSLGTKMLNPKSGLPTANISALCVDRSGVVWMGTNGLGLVKYKSTPFSSFINIKGLDNYNTFAINSDKDGNMWFGSNASGVTVYFSDTAKTYNTSNYLPGNKVRALFRDSKNNMWIGSDGGLTVYDGKSFLTYTTANGLPSNHIRSISEDRKGHIWIGTFGSGAARFDGKTFTYIGSKHGLDNGYVHYIYKDSKDNMWLGTGNGIYKYDYVDFTHYSTLNGLCNSYVGMIKEDAFGNIWFSTDRCLMKYDGIDFKSFTDKDGLSSTTIYLLIFDDDGNLWVGTNKGVDKISFSSYGQITYVHNYSYAEGFTGIECNSRAAHKDASGNIWFGTVGGIMKYTPSTNNSVGRSNPQIHITDVRLFLQPVDWQKKYNTSTNWFPVPHGVTLNHTDNHLTFDFCAIDYVQPEKNRYVYMLEGFDKKWSSYTQTPFVTYSNLPYGKYTFRVKAVNAYGTWSKEEATFTFRIAALFWKTWWFYLLLLILSGVIIYRYDKLQKEKALALKAQLELLVQEKTKQLTKEKEEKEVLLKEIHHRVKNNLQVINSLISIQSGYTNDARAIELFEECKNRIKSMALIHEKLYESKDLSNINIRLYIHNLLSYLIRTYQLDKEIHVAIELDEENFNIDTIIPLGLIINEIISNSLKYAFDDTDSCNISVNIKKQDDGSMRMIIGDNGKGMPRDKFFNNQSTLGIELIKILTEQLSGTVSLLEQPGTTYEIIFRKIIK